MVKIDDIKGDKPHWKVELKKRLLQNTALGIALLALLDSKKLAEGVHPTVPSNLSDYSEAQLAKAHRDRPSRDKIEAILSRVAGYTPTGLKGYPDLNDDIDEISTLFPDIELAKKEQQVKDTAYYAEKMKEAIDRVREAAKREELERITKGIEKIARSCPKEPIGRLLNSLVWQTLEGEK